MSSEITSVLKQCLEKVDQCGRQLGAALKANDIDQIIFHAAQMLEPLTVESLSMEAYNELYASVLDRMLRFHAWIRQFIENGTMTCERIYARVQWVTRLVPRLYLMITVGSVWITRPDMDSSRVHFLFEDMLSMCRGVQNPVRGIFLRAFLNHLTRRALPEQDNDALNASISFLSKNFATMSELWVRLGKQIRRATDVSPEVRARREEERTKLATLPTSCVARYNDLNHVDEEVYTVLILPVLLGRIQTFHDTMVQEKLLESIITSFPDEYHISALDQYQTTLTRLCAHSRARMDPSVMLTNLCKRLGKFFVRDDAAEASIRSMRLWDDLEYTELTRRAGTLPWPSDVDPEVMAKANATLPVFYRLLELVSATTVAVRSGGSGSAFGPQQIIALFGALLDVALQHWPISAANAVLNALAPAIPAANEGAVARTIAAILKRCVAACHSLEQYLQLPAFGRILNAIRATDTQRRVVALAFAQAAVKWGQAVPTCHLDTVLAAIRPITTASDIDVHLQESDIREDTTVICQLLPHLLPSAEDFTADPETALAVFELIRQVIASGNSTRFCRTQYVYPRLIALASARAEVIAVEHLESARAILEWVGTVLAEQRDLTPLIVHRYYVDAARRAAALGFRDLCAAYLLESLLLVEDYAIGYAEKTSWIMDSASAFVEAVSAPGFEDLEDGEFMSLAVNIMAQAGNMLHKGEAAVLVLRTACIWEAMGDASRVDRAVKRAISLLNALRMQITTKPAQLAAASCRAASTALRLYVNAVVAGRQIDTSNVSSLCRAAAAAATHELRAETAVANAANALESYAVSISGAHPEVKNFF